MSADLRSLCLNPVCIPPPPSEHLSTGQRCSRGRSRLRIPVLYPATSSAACSLANSFKWPQIRSCNLKYYDTVQRMSDLAQFYLITSLYYRIETSQYTLSVYSCLIEKKNTIDEEKFEADIFIVMYISGHLTSLTHQFNTVAASTLNDHAQNYKKA